jgi:hypothetical protein
MLYHKFVFFSPHSANALFSVPANRRYVYVQTSHNHLKRDWLDFFLTSLVTTPLHNSVPPESDDPWVPAYGLENEEHIMRPERHEFKLFLGDVLDDARYVREFDDDFGSHAYSRSLNTGHRIEVRKRKNIDASILVASAL